MYGNQETERNQLSNKLASAVSNSSEPQPPQQQQPDDSINMESCFGSKCISNLSDTEIVSNIIEASRRENRNR
jgi:hypothetical protein